MATLNQVCKKRSKRIDKKSFTWSPAMSGNPQLKGVCIKVTTMKPKKPNSAIRKIAKVLLSTGTKVTAYIPGQGHTLQEHSVVLIRGGKVKDLPGIRYKLIRGKYDFIAKERFFRKQRRSKFGIKKAT